MIDQFETQSSAFNSDVHDMILAVKVQGEVEYVNGDVVGFPPTMIIV